MENSNSNSQSEASGTATRLPILSDADLLGSFADAIAADRAKWSAMITDDGNPMEGIARRQLERLADDTPQKRLIAHRKAEADAEHNRKVFAQRQREDLIRLKQSTWDGFIRARGRRYLDCRLSNFETTNQKQTDVLDAVKQFAREIWDRIIRGQNVVLFGPSGTGKDHILTGLVHAAIVAIPTPRDQLRIEWHSGPELYATVRAEIGRDCGAGVVDSAIHSGLLVLSDLIPPSGKLTDYQADTVYRIIDERYNTCRPIWISANVKNRQELDAGLGAAVADRLVDGALTIGCDWPSHRVKAEK